MYYQKGTNLWDAATSRQTATSSIGWPWKPVRYTCQWPTTNVRNSLGTNVIANICEKEVIDPAKYVDWDLYVQNDPNGPGFNPNDEHAVRAPGNGGEAIFPLRDDLGSATTSLAYVLMKYRDGEDLLKRKIKVFKVVATNATYSFRYHAIAGTLLQPPYPLSLFQTEAAGVGGPYWQDRKGSLWAKAAGDYDGIATVVMHYWYPMQPTFYCSGPNPPAAGALLPWLAGGGGMTGTPIDVRFTVYWPDRVPTNGTCGLEGRALADLRVGETLVKAKVGGLPDFQSQSSAEVLYQQAEAKGPEPKECSVDRSHHGAKRGPDEPAPGHSHRKRGRRAGVPDVAATVEESLLLRSAQPPPEIPRPVRRTARWRLLLAAECDCGPGTGDPAATGRRQCRSG